MNNTVQIVGNFSVPFLFAVFAIPTITANMGSCITQSWIAWGLGYTKVETKEFLKLTIPNVYITSAILYVITMVTLAGLGSQWFV